MDILDTCLSIVDGSADKSLLHNNANKASERLPVMKEMVAGEVAKALSKKMLPENIIKAHECGLIHYHDLDQSPLFPFFNCCLVNLEDMLTKGFEIGNAQIEPPNSIATAAAITCQIIAQIASHQYGGVSINRIDEVLAPYVTLSYKKHLSIGLAECENRDKAVIYATNRTKKEVEDACQSMEYEVNTLFTSQGQTPFVTFGFGLGTSWQAKEIQMGLLKQRIKGLGRQRKTAIFPKLVYMVDDKINAKDGDPNYHDVRKLAIECASRRNYPDILNMPMLRKVGCGCAPMGCRSFLSEWTNPETGNLQWEGRNNLGVISINLPRLGLLSEDEEVFFENLKETLAISKEALDTRVNRLRGVKAKVAPILYCAGAISRLHPEEEVFKVFENGRASISLGFIGIHEMCEAMFPNEEPILTNHKKQEFARQVMKALRDAVDSWKKLDGLSYGLYATPSESLCDRFCRIDQEEFGIIDGVTDKDYYTNSFHLDVSEMVSPFTKIDFEKEYHQWSSSGNITYVEIPNVDYKNREIMIDVLWQYVYDKLPYFGTNCSIDHCHKCHWDGDAEATEEGFKCPQCGNTELSTLEITKRVCGYLGNANSRPFNHGKQVEVTRRVKHN